MDKTNLNIVRRERKSDGFLKVYALKLTHDKFDGTTTPLITREVVERGHAVGVIAYDDQRDSVVLVEQFRVGAIEDEQSPWLLEFPAGMVKEGEVAEEVARRECLEEIGREPETLEWVTKCYLSPGGCDETITMLYGGIDSQGLDGTVHGVDGEHEDIRVRVVPLPEALRMVRDGRIRNASTILGLYWLAARR
jgi:ADP-ribose pyrophosphatase